ncbi:glycosyltransferase [Erwinia sp. S38]|uniref:glycosyltransferase n=1 Tax=Erwinia sp. S38 TaxID=2769338 RepID=UPI00190D2D03|nr:glycosyltransferase [Erwinia sp. S38]MBK0002087.1 glycosyltransferase [Erwinia sp. S38]
MKEILVLSHTRGDSVYKIGSHHYANGLSEKNYNITYIGIPYTVIHRLLKKDFGGERQLVNSVNEIKLNTLLPITLDYNSLLIAINKFYDYLYGFFRLRNRKNKFDVIICDYPYFEPYLSIFDYSMLVYRPTDNYISMSGESVIPYEEKLINRSDLIVATSQNVLDNLETKYKISNSDSYVISNGFDDKHFYFNETIEKKGAVYIGAIDYRFDLDGLQILAENFPEDKFHIYGPISKDLIKRAEEISSIYSNVKFYGKISYNKTPEVLQKAAVGLLLLNDHESNIGRSPMKLWEYASSGLNIVFSRVEIDSSDLLCLYKYETQADLINKYFEARSQEFSKEDLNKVKAYSWRNKVDKINSIIENKSIMKKAC